MAGGWTGRQPQSFAPVEQPQVRQPSYHGLPAFPTTPAPAAARCIPLPMLQPPPEKSVAGAIRTLQDVGALTPSEELTPLGAPPACLPALCLPACQPASCSPSCFDTARIPFPIPHHFRACISPRVICSSLRSLPAGHHLAALPVDARIGKLLLLSASLGCLAPALTIAACLSYKSPFSGGTQQDAADRARAALAAPGSGTIAAGQQSDHLLMVAAVDGWLAARAKGGHKGGVGAYSGLTRGRRLQQLGCDGVGISLPDVRCVHYSLLACPPGSCSLPSPSPLGAYRCSGVQPAALPVGADAGHAGRHALAVCHHACRHWLRGG